MTVRVAIATQRLKELVVHITRFKKGRAMSNSVVLYENPCDTCGKPLIVREGKRIDEMVHMDMMGIYRCLRCNAPVALAPVADVVLGQGNNELHRPGQSLVV